MVLIHEESLSADVRRVVDGLVNEIAAGIVRGSTEVAERYAKTVVTVCERSSSVIEAVKGVCLLSIKAVRARPTSALLANTARRILRGLLEARADTKDSLCEILRSETGEVIKEFKSARDQAARIASMRIKSGDTIMTFSYSTTVLKTFEYALASRKTFKVIVAESRPRSEGLYTASQLDRLGVETVLIVDSAINYFMRKTDRAFIGAEAIAANGAVINKVGTSLLALAAKHARVPVYVVAGTYKFSVETVFGELIELSKARPEEVVEDKSLLELGVNVEAPLMDATPPQYIDAIVTERGLIAPTAVPLVLEDMYGSWPPKVEPIDELVRRVLKAYGG